MEGDDKSVMLRGQYITQRIGINCRVDCTRYTDPGVPDTLVLAEVSTCLVVFAYNPKTGHLFMWHFGPYVDAAVMKDELLYALNSLSSDGEDDNVVIYAINGTRHAYTSKVLHDLTEQLQTAIAEKDKRELEEVCDQVHDITTDNINAKKKGSALVLPQSESIQNCACMMLTMVLAEIAREDEDCRLPFLYDTHKSFGCGNTRKTTTYNRLAVQLFLRGREEAWDVIICSIDKRAFPNCICNSEEYLVVQERARQLLYAAGAGNIQHVVLQPKDETFKAEAEHLYRKHQGQKKIDAVIYSAWITYLRMRTYEPEAKYYMTGFDHVSEINISHK